MTAKSTFLDPAISEYIVKTVVREHPVLRELREVTSRRPNARMAIGPEQGEFMQLLARTIGARRYLEIGVFTGYSSLAMALALPSDGYVLACDVSEEYTKIARHYWEAAGVAHKIDLRIAPALETLASLSGTEIEKFDIAFIDADKVNVDAYYERALELVRIGGLVIIDNVLWDGAVLDPATGDPETQALQAMNAKAGRDPRVDVALVPVCDGILVARKRDPREIGLSEAAATR
ncbi:MAG: class I SAM-dependent methyltransferase [Candidatus Eremiobacteraeota bacterium]|nr:class I SAM-dependent methyltransferase [Candidatus Eremiobacteraeota bacterium]